MKWNNSSLPERRITYNIYKQHHLSWSDKVQLKRLAVDIASNHDEEGNSGRVDSLLAHLTKGSGMSWQGVGYLARWYLNRIRIN